MNMEKSEFFACHSVFNISRIFSLACIETHLKLQRFQMLGLYRRVGDRVYRVRSDLYDKLELRNTTEDMKLQPHPQALVCAKRKSNGRLENGATA